MTSFRRWPANLRAYAAVGLGGAVGAVLRQLVVETVDVSSESHAGIFVVNVLGSAALALVLITGERYVGPKSIFHYLWRPFMVTGVLGGFTTTSAYAVVTAQAIHNQQLETFLVFGIGSVVLALAVHGFVYQVASRIFKAAA